MVRRDDDSADGGPRYARRTFIRRSIGIGVGMTALPTLVTACDGGSTAPSAAAPSANATAAPAATLAPETAGVFYPPSYVGPRARTRQPFADGAKTFRVVVPQDTAVVGDWNKNQCTAWMEKYTGLKVSFETISTTNNDMTKVNAMIASGDLPDAFLGIPFSRDQVSLYGSQGVFVPLDDHIAHYAVELKQAMTDYPDAAALAKSADGKTYAFSAINDCYHCHASAGRTFVNKAMVEKAGGKVPETTEEFRAFLKALKANNANGHGDVVALTAGVDNPLDTYFMSPFLYNPGDPWLRLDGGKVAFVANTPQWRDALKFLRSMFDDGTLTPDVFTMTTEALTKLGNTPGHARIGVARAFYWGSFVDIDLTDPNARWTEYEAMPPLTGPDGTKQARWDYYTSYLPAQMVVTKQCPDPTQLVQWADYQMGLEGIMACNKGRQSTNWSWAPKGVLGINGEQAVFAVKGMPAPVGQSWNQYATMYRSNDQRLSQSVDDKHPTFEKPLYLDTKRAYEPYRQPQEWQLPPLIFDESAAATNADTATSISNHVKQSMAQFATAKLDINDDGVWATYTDAIDKMGLAQYLKNYQRAYDSRPTG